MLVFANPSPKRTRTERVAVVMDGVESCIECDQRRVVASDAVLTVVSEGNGKNEPEGVAWSGVRGLFARLSIE